MLEAMAARVRKVADWKSIELCSRAHLVHVSSWALEARALSSFSKFSCVRTGAFGGGMTGGLELEGEVDLGFEERAILNETR